MLPFRKQKAISLNKFQGNYFLKIKIKYQHTKNRLCHFNDAYHIIPSQVPNIKVSLYTEGSTFFISLRYNMTI